MVFKFVHMLMCLDFLHMYMASDIWVMPVGKFYYFLQSLGEAPFMIV